MKKRQLQLLLIISIVIQLSLTSCNNYYKAISMPVNNSAAKAASLDSLKHANRTFILRNDRTAFSMDSLVIQPDQNKMDCILYELSDSNKLHLSKGRNGKMRYEKSEPLDIPVLKEVHVYIRPDSNAVLGKYSVPLDNVQKIEMIEKDKQRTSSSHLTGGLIGVALVLTFAFLILAASGGLEWKTGP